LHAEGDLIDFSAIGDMTFIGTDAFSNVAGELRTSFRTATIQADLVLELKWRDGFAGGDFLLA
jgi:hypothetical protein